MSEIGHFITELPKELIANIYEAEVELNEAKKEKHLRRKLS